jgi:hypothetical protein
MKLRRQWRHFWWIKDSEIKVRAGQLPFQNAHFLMRQNVAEPIRTCHLIYSGYLRSAITALQYLRRFNHKGKRLNKQVLEM